MRILLMADTHIPDRAFEVPALLRSRLEDDASTSDVVVHAGDLTSEDILEWVKELSRTVYVVTGNMDYLPLPSHAIFEAHGVRVGVVHGHQVYPRGDIPKLTAVARRLGVRILVSAHTHSAFLESWQGVVHLNPGSLTGVWGGGGGSMIPSYMVADLEEGSLLVVKLCKLVNDRLGCQTKSVQL